MQQPTSVLDASALLAWLRGEPGHSLVLDALSRTAAISAVNWAETLSKLADAGLDPIDAAAQVQRRGVLGTLLLVRSFDETQAHYVARLRAATRAYGLSLADRACLALAGSLELPALTIDRSWKTLDVKIDIRLIR